jgi:plastocyanin
MNQCPQQFRWWGVLRCVVAGASLVLLAAGADAPPDQKPPAPPTTQVSIDNFTFSPQTLVIAPGTTVTWVNHDDVPHTATSAAKPRAFDSGALDTDQKFSHEFTTAGVFPYFCAVHPHMTGQITVK